MLILLLFLAVNVTGDPKATMSYAKYERDIVDKYNIVLEGWPFPTIRNLADERASNSELVQLYQRLIHGECFFRKLTQEEIHARSAGGNGLANSSGKSRAPRLDKGVKRGPQQATLARRAASGIATGTGSADAPGAPNIPPRSVSASVSA